MAAATRDDIALLKSELAKYEAENKDSFVAVDEDKEELELNQADVDED